MDKKFMNVNCNHTSLLNAFPFRCCNTRKYHDVLTNGNVLLIFALAALTNLIHVIRSKSKQYLISIIETFRFYDYIMGNLCIYMCVYVYIYFANINKD